MVIYPLEWNVSVKKYMGQITIRTKFKRKGRKTNFKGRLNLKTQEQITTTDNALRIEMSPLKISQGSKLNSLWNFITGHAQACQVLN